MAKGILLYTFRTAHESALVKFTWCPRLCSKEKSQKSHHDIFGLVDGLNVIAVVVLSMVNLNIVMGNIQENLMC